MRKRWIVIGVALATVIGLHAADVDVNMGTKTVPDAYVSRIVSYLAALPNRLMVTNTVETVDPPVLTNEWDEVEGDLANCVLSNDYVIAYTNYFNVPDPSEGTVAKFKRVYYSKADRAFLADLRAWERQQWLAAKEAEWNSDYPSPNFPEQ